MSPFPSPNSWLWGNSSKATKLRAGLAGRLEGVFRPPPFQHTLPSTSAHTDLLFHILAYSHLILEYWTVTTTSPSLLDQKIPQAQCCWEGFWTQTQSWPQTQTWNSLPPLPTICLLLGWPKSSFGFKVQVRDTFFIFTKNFIEQHIHRLFPLLFCHFPGNFIISSSQNLLSFWAKNCFKCVYGLPGNWNFFH